MGMHRYSGTIREMQKKISRSWTYNKKCWNIAIKHLNFIKISYYLFKNSDVIFSVKENYEAELYDYREELDKSRL